VLRPAATRRRRTAAVAAQRIGVARAIEGPGGGGVTSHGHHSVYVVYLRNPKGNGKAGYYVGMTGLTPEQRFQNHKSGIKAARVVKKHGVRLVPKLYAHLNPMTYEKAKRIEVALAESLRKRGFVVYGGH
jgi:predicted GIY-YIG superfamily endonuclease